MSGAFDPAAFMAGLGQLPQFEVGRRLAELDDECRGEIRRWLDEQTRQRIRAESVPDAETSDDRNNQGVRGGSFHVNDRCRR
jgi:hypothetical protein